MSFITFHPPLTGFHFELRVDRLLGSLNYTVMYSNGHIPCLETPPHNRGIHHEFDHYVIFRHKPENIPPRYSENSMLVSCKKSLGTMAEIRAEKIKLLQLIKCFNANVTDHNTTAKAHEKMSKIKYGLIIGGDKVPRNTPDLGDKIFFWDLSRCFFYAWRGYFTKNLGVPVIYGEHKLDQKSSFIFGTVGDPDSEYNQGECQIFFDAHEQLNQNIVETYLKKVMYFVKNSSTGSTLIKKGKIYVTFHTLNQFPNQVLDRKDDIAESVSDTKIEFYIQSYYNHSIAPWDPLTRPMSRFFSGL